MDQNTRALLANELEQDEGFREKPYLCTANRVTIGIGRNLDDRGITKEEARYLLQNDIDDTEEDLDRVLPDWRSFSGARQRALGNMMFNLGRDRFCGFKKMIAAINNRDWDEAAAQALDSKWAKQVGDRADRVAALLRDG